MARLLFTIKHSLNGTETYSAKMFVFALVLTTFPSIGECKLSYQLVERCPITEDSWRNREKAFPCSPLQGEFYHCFRTGEESMIEICQSLRIFSPKDGCPYLTLESGSPNTSTFYFTCSSRERSCPKPSDESYKSNTLYKYRGCLELNEPPYTRQVIDTTQHKLNTRHFTRKHSNAFETRPLSTIGQNRDCCSEKDEKKEKGKEIGKDDKGFILESLHIALVVIGVLVVTVIFTGLAAITFYKRMKRYKIKLHRATYVTTSHVSQEEVGSYSYGIVYNDIAEPATPPGSTNSGYEKPYPFITSPDDETATRDETAKSVIVTN